MPTMFQNAEARMYDCKAAEGVLLFSGGLDSLCAWFALGRPPALTFYLPAPCGAKEFQAAKSLAKMLNMEHRADTFFANGGWQGAGIISIATLFPLVARTAELGYNRVITAMRGEAAGNSALGAKHSETMGEWASRLSGARVEVVFPFWGSGQDEIVGQALAHGATPEHLLRSSSCPSEQPGHCGICQKCMEKAEVFLQNGIEWPKGYFKTPIEVEYLIGCDAEFREVGVCQ